MPALPAATNVQPRPPLSRDELRDVLAVALYAGQLMLENGANTQRAEETVAHFGRALGAQSLDIMVMPNSIVATAQSHGEHRTKIQRVTRSGVDLSRLTAILDLSRRAERTPHSAAEVHRQLEVIAQQPRLYGPIVTALGVGMACGAFTALFGGNPIDIGLVALTTTFAQLLRHDLLGRGFDRQLTTGIVAALAVALTIILATIAPQFQPSPVSLNIVLAATVLLLVPGVQLVSGTADLFRGDISAGSARITAAMLILLAIAFGVWTVLALAQVPIDLGSTLRPSLPFAIAASFVAATGFAVLFDVPPRYILFSGLVGAVAVATRNGLLGLNLQIEVAAFAAGLAVGLCAALLARVRKAPAALFAIPGYIPLVPGVPAFRAVLRFVAGDYVGGLGDALQALLIILAIAVGLGITYAITGLRRSG